MLIPLLLTSVAIFILVPGRVFLLLNIQNYCQLSLIQVKDMAEEVDHQRKDSDSNESGGSNNSKSLACKAVPPGQLLLMFALWFLFN